MCASNDQCNLIDHEIARWQSKTEQERERERDREEINWEKREFSIIDNFRRNVPTDGSLEFE